MNTDDGSGGLTTGASAGWWLYHTGAVAEHLLPRGSPDVIGNSEFCSVSAKFPNINFSFFSPDHRQRNTRLSEGVVLQCVHNTPPRDLRAAPRSLAGGVGYRRRMRTWG